MKTLIFDLKLRLAGEKLTRSIEQFYRSVPDLEDTRVTSFVVAKAADINTPTSEIYQPINGAKLTILVPKSKVDIQITIGADSFTFTDVLMPVVIPGAVTSIQLTNKDATKTAEVFILQGSGV